MNRLWTAQTLPNSNVTQWGQSFTYDGFGNLTNVSVTAGSAPQYSANYNPATNQQYSDCADANGNLKAVLGGACTAGNWYDVENRVITPNSNAPVYGSGGSETSYYYSYAPGNKRVWRGSWVLTGSSLSRGTDYVSFYAPNGQKLAEYSLASYYGSGGECDPQNPIFYATQTGTYYYFGGRMIKNESGWVYPDRLGSIGKFYPYGTERPAATTNGTEKFTGYFRDAETGNDYAINRYELPGQGRFMSPDPYRAITGGPGDPSDPGSWDKYAYVAGDPINRNDPAGLFYANNPNGGGPGTEDPTDPGTGDPIGGCSVPGCNQAKPRRGMHPGGGSGGSANSGKVNAELRAAYTLAEVALANPDCANLFQPLDAQVSAATVLTDLLNGAIYGSITVGALPSAPGTTVSATTTPGIIVNGAGSPQNAAYIIINDLAGTFITGTIENQAVTLLHELGHAMNDIFGAGTSVIQQDGQGVANGTQISMQNTALIDSTCFKNAPPSRPVILP